MRARIVTLFIVASLFVSWSSGANGEEIWGRVAHSEIRHACISDGSARMQHYWDVVAFDWGGVVPLNSWYHPQLFRYRPGDSALEHLALALPHEGMGNEDDPRIRLAAHYGNSPADSHVMFTIFGYEEIENENGLERRDTAVMAIRPMESRENPGAMPRRTARVINIDPEEAKNGVGRVAPRCGAVYDQQRRLVFVARDRSGNLKNRELLQVFRFDSAEGRFLGRQSVVLPESMVAKHNATFAHVSPENGLVAVGATTFWSPQKSRSAIYLMEYDNAADNGDQQLVTIRSLQATTDLTVADGQGGTIEPTSAVMARHAGRVILIVGSGTEFTKSGEELSAGLFLFDLGPVGGPYSISAPQVHIPFPHAVMGVEIVGEDLIVSARGIHCYKLSEVAESIGKRKIAQPTQRIPLPYDTHGMDAASIDGRDVLFVASGRNGLDTFELRSRDAADSPDVRDDLTSSSAELGELSKSVLLETGAEIRHIGRPTLNNRGAGSVWAVLKDGREAILSWDVGKTPKPVFATNDSIVSIGQPVLNDDGQIAVWVGHHDGAESVFTIREGDATWRAGGEQIALSNVRQSDDGQLVFAIADARRHPNRSIGVVGADNKITKVFEENREEKRTLGTGIHGNFVGDFDIDINGRVALVVQHGSREPHIYSWQAGELHDHGSPGQHVQKLTFAREANRITFRLWKDEVVSQSMVDLRVGQIEQVQVLAHRRQSYGQPPANPGDFFAARGDSRGNVVFATVENSQSGNGTEILGNQLWHARHGGARPSVMIKPGDKIGDAEILNARFRDGFSDRGWAVTTLDVRLADGELRQWMVRLFSAGTR